MDFIIYLSDSSLNRTEHWIEIIQLADYKLNYMEKKNQAPYNLHNYSPVRIKYTIEVVFKFSIPF